MRVGEWFRYFTESDARLKKSVFLITRPNSPHEDHNLTSEYLRSRILLRLSVDNYREVR